MIIAIIAAMKVETEFLITQLQKVNKKLINQYDFYEGKIGNHDIIVVQGGVGKTASGMLISTLVMAYPQVDKIINIGVAGGVLGKTVVGDIIISEFLVYGDVDITTAGDYEYGQMSNCPRLFKGDFDLINIMGKSDKLKGLLGTIVSSDRFVTDITETTELIKNHFTNLNILCFDMESAAFAHACYFYHKPFIAIRSISDVIGENLHNEFSTNLEFACKKSNLFILELLKEL
ncbi:MAG: 5'-methylthioadenosine/adenosylhomocysteine nucleosidase [Bacilli bacterium]